MKKNLNDVMNAWLRGGGVFDKPVRGSEISDEQLQRIEKYLDLGVSYHEARDLVLGFRPVKVPTCNAGEGRGDVMRASSPMNELIRKAAGISWR